MGNTVIIKRTLKELGVTPSLKGYYYHLVDAIDAVIDDRNRLVNICKVLYVDIALKYQSTYAAVERGIRDAILKSYTYAPLEDIERVFGNILPPTRDVPTNKQYIATVADYIRDNLL